MIYNVNIARNVNIVCPRASFLARCQTNFQCIVIKLKGNSWDTT